MMLASTADAKDPNVRLSYQEGYDADISSNQSADGPKKLATTSVEGCLESGYVARSRIGIFVHEKAEGQLQQEQEQADPNIVWWDEPADQDPENPMNWTEKKKWINIALLAMCTLITYVGGQEQDMRYVAL